jgi:hypothetical protein
MTFHHRRALFLLLPIAMTMALHCSAQPITTRFFVSPAGDDGASGTQEAPFLTVPRAQAAAREAAATATGDVVVTLAAGTYRLARPLVFDVTDSGRKGKVVYRSGAGPGTARLLGSVPLVGWQQFRDGIWQIPLPEGPLPHTLYEDGKRAHKARFPNYVYDPEFPTARGPYLVTEAGCEAFEKDQGTAWLTYAEADTPPTTDITQMRIAIYLRGKCDWMRTIYRVRSIDPAQRQIVIDASRMYFGILARARYFLEDELALLDAPGEFHADAKSRTLYYKPIGEGHPDSLGIALPVLDRLIEIKGESRENGVRNLRFEGLSLGETNGNPSGWWGKQYGRTDGALIHMTNAQGVEIRDCHLRNSGRHGIVLVGHNTDNRIEGCWIEHMGLNGITLSNRFTEPGNKPTEDRCARNVIRNCLIHNIGEIHTYASCVNLFNVEDNDIGYCEMHDSVRYAVTVRGNTGEQFGPPVSTNLPPCTGNRIHHIRAYRCGQDGGDMGTLHCANLNNPGGGFVNTFEQITVADSRAVPSMHDIGPDGIFLDWPRMSMDQIFRNVEIIRSQGTQLRSHKPENGDSAQTDNVSWKPGFDQAGMDYENIGLTKDFPAAFGGRPPIPSPPTAPRLLAANAPDHHTVVLRWQPPAHAFSGTPQYTVLRDGAPIAKVTETTYTDSARSELTSYEYRVSAQDGDFCHVGPASPPCRVTTPADRIPPVVKSAWTIQGTNRLRIAFSKPMAPTSLADAGSYTLSTGTPVLGAQVVSPMSVELTLGTPSPTAGCTLSVRGATDATASHNALETAPTPVKIGASGAVYGMQTTDDGLLFDSFGGAGDAVLHGDAKVVADAGPSGGPALVLDGEGDYAEASPDFNVGADEFTIAAWVWRERGGCVIVSKGNGFADPNGWSFGWDGEGKPGSVALRNLNQYYATAARSVPMRIWTHVAIVRRGNRAFTYANGEPSGEPYDFTEVTGLQNNEPLRIGRRAHEPNPAYFQGKIADLRLLGYALSSDEIRALASTPPK